MARHVSYSELRDFRQCPLKHHLSWVERWRPEEASAALSKGRLFHSVLEAHYTALRDGSDPEVAALSVLDLVEDEELRDLCQWMYDGYLDCYGWDEGWEVLDVEATHHVWLPTDILRRSGFRIKARLDLLARDREGRIWLWDHKTCSRFPTEVSLDLQDQDSLYQWALGEAGSDVYGVVYNLCRTQRNKGPMALEDRFRRVAMHRSPVQLVNTAIDAWRTAKRISAAKNPERTTDSERCTRMCAFTEACLHGRKGGDMEDFLSSQGFTRNEGDHS